MVGDEGRRSAGGSDFTAACEHLPALRIRLMGGSLAQESGAGLVVVVRYADDLVVGFQSRTEAERFLKEFRERLAKFGLELHAEKTRLIEFGRFAVENRNRRGVGKPETFTFLGFTHYCGKLRKDGAFIIWRETAKKRLVAKIQAIKTELKRRPPSRAARVRRSMAPEGDLWLLPIPRSSRQLAPASTFPLADTLGLVARIIAPQPAWPARHGPA